MIPSRSVIRSIICASALLLAGAAHAGIPLLNYSCPGDISVHADKGGPVYINGQQAKLKTVNENYYEATDQGSGVTVSISVNPDGSPSLSYTGKHGANGVCQSAASGDDDSSSESNGGPFKMTGQGTVTLGGPLMGKISSKNGRSYALVLSAITDGFTCTGSFDERPGSSDKSMSTTIHCTNGDSGSAILKGKLLTFSAGRKGGSVTFR